MAPGPPGCSSVADLVGLVDRFAVDRDDHVVELEHLRRRAVLGDAPHDGAGGADVDVVAEALERHRDGDELRGVHQLRVVATVLRLGPAAAHRLLRQRRRRRRRASRPAPRAASPEPMLDRRVGDRLLRRVARGPFDEHLLGDRPRRSGSQRHVRHRDERRAEHREREHAPTTTTSAIQRRRGRRPRRPRAPRARPRAVARRPAVASAHSVVSERAAAQVAAERRQSVEVSEVAERDDRPWWVRVRSGVLLVAPAHRPRGGARPR